MIKTGHLGRFELFSLAVLAAVADIFLNYPQQLVLMGGPAGWMIPLISMGICLGIWAVIGPVLSKRGDGNLLSLIRGRSGRWAVGIVSVIVVILLMLDMATTMRVFVETVITTLLPRSPISFIAVPLLLVIVYFAYSGVEGLSRVAWFVTPWFLIGLTVLLLLNTNWMNPEYILPLWGTGIPGLLFSGGIVTGVFLNVLILVFLSPLLRNPKDSMKIGFWSIVAVGFIYSIVTLVFIMAFPTETSSKTAIPLYQLARLIYIGRFLQRLEAAFAFFWIAVALIKIAVSLWISTYLIAAAFRMPVNRPLVFPMGLVMYSLAFFPKSFPEALEANNFFRLHWGWTVVVGLPLVLLLWVRFRNRKEGTGNHEASQTS
ncbi:GerAB/ArcD/ProY family transporter [Effusibacillus lacus]|uniref:Uncharacterized protein n=1 Tax=Effusibacillus lacus TaxID=1348429 RepID=A0A292YTX3_9BACL|nr:endospore germination permease [Effusibacillus lacus]TCS73566.1 spore germination protein (amino acid permease) [Effusibacillus lacus]GAX91940.1 hypothetical protein EFBL_3631 [Effusibacillus lacus]